MGVSVAIVAAAAISAGSAAYSNNEAKRGARIAGDKQKNAQDRLLGEQKAKEDELAAAQDRASARARQRALAAGAQGRSGTILTSPTGVAGNADPAANKTLIGY